MRRDPVVAGALELAEAWEKEADTREQRAPGVPDAVVATLKTNAAELRKKIEQVEADTAYLSAGDYAALNGTSESTVRRLCSQGLIDGATKNANDDWRIPRGAKRLSQPRDMAVAS